MMRSSLVLPLMAALLSCGPQMEQPTAPSPQQSDEVFLFSHSPGVAVDILPRDVFLKRHRDNADLPRTGAAILELARRLYPPLGEDLIPLNETCGEHLEGTLFAALANPDIPHNIRRRVDWMLAASTPKLPLETVIGHFKFLYTTCDTNPDHNVTLAQVQQTAKVLNAAWDDYALNFKEPKHYLESGKKLVNVKVYYLGSSLYGSTSSYWDYMRLNSKRVVRNNCKRQTTPVHELFHRVQYVHGYITGTPGLKWAVEGTAAWSQKYRAKHVGDWMYRMDSGLKVPNKALFDRSYDAALLWVYLGRWIGEYSAQRLLWQNYQAAVGLSKLPMTAALDRVLQSTMGRSVNHPWLVDQWAMANLLKETASASWTQTYEEQDMGRRCEGYRYGPLQDVARGVTLTFPNACGGALEKQIHQVHAYGSDYITLKISPSVKKLSLTLKADDPEFSFSIVELDSASKVLKTTRSGLYSKELTYAKDFSGSGGATLELVTTAMSLGGYYTFTAQTDEASKCGLYADQCNHGGCLNGACVKSPKPDGTKCDDSDPKTNNDQCVKGTCKGS